MTNNFDEELTVTLRERAGAVPPRPDLAGAAIRRAHGIRRRRRITGAVAAAATLAIAVPVGLRAGDGLTRGNAPIPPATQVPDTDGDTDGDTEDGRGDDRNPGDLTSALVTLELAELTAGNMPAVPYLDGSQLIVDGEAVDLGVAAAEISQVAYAGDSAYFTVNTNGNLELRSSADEDSGIAVDGGPWASPDERYVAYLAGGAIEVRDTTDGTTSTVGVGAADYLPLVTFVGDDLYFVAGNDPTLMRWTIGDAEAIRVDGIRKATAISPDGELVADQYQVKDLEASSCTQVKALGTGKQLWETCDFRILGFSADGRYAVGANEYADGAGDPFMVVLDVETSAMVLRVEGPRRANPPVLFRRSRFESESTLLIDAGQGSTAALVRCDLTSGECELATELAESALAYEEGGSPYRLLD